MELRSAIQFGQGGSTFFTPLALALILIGAIALLCFPRKYAIVGLLVPGLLLHLSQRVQVGGLDFFSVRILVLVGLIRVLATDFRAFKLKPPLDRAMLWYTVAGLVTFTLLWMSTSALINRIGVTYTILGGYVVARSLVRDREDVRWTLKVLSAVCIVLTVTMWTERTSGMNPLAVLGAQHPEMREGAFRARGAFGHSILAGSFAATLFPLFVGLLRRENGARLFGILGVVATSAMVAVSVSSTPMMAYAAGIAGLLAWKVRGYTKQIKWATITALVVLHIVMEAPVWALIYKLSFLTGGSGWHRFLLVDACIRHFWDWWLVGAKDFGMWGYDLWDTANTYVSIAETGGLITLIFFIMVIRRAFAALSEHRARVSDQPLLEWQAWTFTCALFAHAVALFGISYFDQTMLLWVVFLATIGAVTTTAAKPVEAVTQPELSRVPRLAQPSYSQSMSRPMLRKVRS